MKTKVFKFSQKNKFENPFHGKKMSKKVIGKPFFIINYLNNGNLSSHDFNMQWTETQFLIQQITDRQWAMTGEY